MNNCDLIVVGAGASGLMAAGTAAERGRKVLLIDKNEKNGRKLMITGKGRCNVTNNCGLINDLIANVPANGRFLYGAFTRFSHLDTMEFFENLGVPLKVERGNRVFPVSDKASDIVDALTYFNEKSGVERIQGRVKEVLTKDGKVTGVLLESGERYSSHNVLIAAGGLSYPKTGSTGDGYRMAESLGHTVTPLKPSLVPLVCHENWCTDCMGLSLKNSRITVTEKESYKEVYTDFGEMLFTHFGVSGPMILSASAHMKNLGEKKYIISIDLKPALTHEQLDRRIQSDFREFSKKVLINSLGNLLPRKLIPVIVRLSRIPPMTPTSQITREQRQTLTDLLKNLTVTAVDFAPIEEAVITSGGVSVKEIDPKTMESKLVKGLYFAGEVIDVDAYTGGFNLQIAFSTGRLAGMSV